MHVESSMTIPTEFSRQALSFGVTTVVADPHEIANVFGLSGIEAFMASEPVMVFSMESPLLFRRPIRIAKRPAA